MAERQARRREQGSYDSRLDWAGERIVRMVVIVAMLAFFAPLVTQSLAGFPELGPLQFDETSTVEVALYSVLLLVLGRDGISWLLRRVDASG